MTELQVIVPCLDEAEALPCLLDDLAGQRGVSLSITVADGGSVDRSREIAAASGATVIRCERGRARQMNAAAATPLAETLLFLHADTRMRSPELLRNALDALQGEGADSSSTPIAGHFALHFTNGSPTHAALYAHMARKSRLNRRLTINGDQGLLIRARHFAALGGYDESLPFLEDLRLASRIVERGRWVQLPGELETSARRFEAEGVRARYLLMGLIGTMHEGGIEAYFDGAAELYAEQRDARRLSIRPWVQRARRLLLAGGPLAFMQRMWRIGRATRSQFWHLPYAIDLRRGHADTPGPTLRRWDRRVQPWLENPLGTAVGTLVATLLIFGPWVWRWVDADPENPGR